MRTLYIPFGLGLLLSLGAAQTVLVDGTSNAGSFESGNACNTGTFTADGWTIVKWDTA